MEKSKEKCNKNFSKSKLKKKGKNRLGTFSNSNDSNTSMAHFLNVLNIILDKHTPPKCLTTEQISVKEKLWITGAIEKRNNTYLTKKDF